MQTQQTLYTNCSRNMNVRSSKSNVSQRRQALNVILKEVKTFFCTSTIHGLRFIAQKERHWTERIFWLICCLLSWYASAELMVASWHSFQYNAVSFAMETSYIEFNTNFPSVVICELDNDDRIAKVMTSMFGNHAYDLEEVYKEVTYFRGEAHFIKRACFTDKLDCPRSGLTEIAKKFRTPCSKALFNCSWNQAPFNCCDHFLNLDTEFGACFSINNIHAQSAIRNYVPLDMNSNLSTGPGSLYFASTIQSKVYVVSTFDVPSLNSPERSQFLLKLNTSMHRWFTVKEVENERGVKDLSIAQRECRFPDDNNLSVYPQYSYGGCVAECRKREQIRLCNCTSHQMPNTKDHEICSLEGIVCINDHYLYLSVLRSGLSQKFAIRCACDTSCEDQIIFESYATLNVLYDDTVATLELTMDSIPRERFKRNVVRGKLDLVGGAAGLFVGASLISFVEIIFYIPTILSAPGRNRQKIISEAETNRVNSYDNLFQSILP